MKKILSILLVFTLFCALGTTAHAENTLTWSLSNGILTIEGQGEMHDFAGDIAPWRSYEKSILEISVGYGVTHVGDQAFQYLTQARQATFSTSLTSLGDGAFYGCKSLEFVLLPDSLKELGVSVFDHCSKLEKVTLPASIDTIPNAAFNCCTALKEVFIPASVTTIEDSAFNACRSLKTVYFGGSEKQWREIDIAGYNKYLISASIVFNADPSEHITSSDSVWFKNDSSVTWTLSKDKTLTISGHGAMHDYSTDVAPWDDSRSDIKRIVIEDGITHIGAQAFQYCSHVKSVSIPETVTSIGDAAFFRCSELTEIALPSGLTELGEQAFDHCSALKTVSIPSGVTEIKTSTFNCCRKLASISIPASVTYIGNSAFNACQSLTQVIFGGTSRQWAEIEIESYNSALSKASVRTSDMSSSGSSAITGVV